MANSFQMCLDPGMGNSIRFIRLVERYPILYDATCDRYSDRNLTEKVWMEIAEEVGENVMYCKEKWRNIRSSYTRWLRNRINARKFGRRIRPYYLAKHLQFLESHTRRRDPSPDWIARNDEIQIQLEPSDSYDSYIVLNTEDFEQSDEIQERSIEDIPAEDVPLIKYEYEIETNNEDTASVYSEEYNGENKREEDSSYEEPYSKQQKHLLEEVNQNSEEEHPTLLFFRSIMPDVKKLNEKQNLQLKLVILEKLSEFLEHDINSASTSIS